VATPLTKFRLDPVTLDAVAALAASNGGNATTAVKEAACQWHAAVAEAGRQNADELSVEDWHRLAHLNDPDPFAGLVESDALSRHGTDWSNDLAMQLVGMWEGKPIVLPAHKTESRECAKLAKRVAALGRVRGYALMAALRYFWRTPDAGIEACRAPEVWLTPTAKERA
jgi:hypothetical protein